MVANKHKYQHFNDSLSFPFIGSVCLGVCLYECWKRCRETALFDMLFLCING